MTDHTEFHDLLHADLDGELAPENRARLAELLAQNPAYAEEARELRALREVFRAVGPVGAPEDFGAVVMERVRGAGEAQRARGRLLRLAPWVSAAAAAVLVAVVLWDSGVLRPGAPDTAVATAPADSGAPSRAQEQRKPGRSEARTYTESDADVVDREGGRVTVDARRRRDASDAAETRRAAEDLARELGARGRDDLEPAVAREAAAGAEPRAEEGREKSRGASATKDATTTSRTPAVTRPAPDPEPVAPPGAPAKRTVDGARSKDSGGGEDAGGAGADERTAELRSELENEDRGLVEAGSTRYVVFHDRAAARRFAELLRQTSTRAAVPGASGKSGSGEPPNSRAPAEAPPPAARGASTPSSGGGAGAGPAAGFMNAEEAEELPSLSVVERLRVSADDRAVASLLSSPPGGRAVASRFAEDALRRRRVGGKARAPFADDPADDAASDEAKKEEAEGATTAAEQGPWRGGSRAPATARKGKVDLSAVEVVILVADAPAPPARTTPARKEER